METVVLGRQGAALTPPPPRGGENFRLIPEGAATDGSGWITIIILIVKRLCPALWDEAFRIWRALVIQLAYFKRGFHFQQTKKAAIKRL